MNTIRGLCHSIKILTKLKSWVIFQHLLTKENIVLEHNLQIIKKQSFHAAISFSGTLFVINPYFRFYKNLNQKYEHFCQTQEAVVT